MKLIDKYTSALRRGVAVLLLVALEDELRVLISQNVLITDLKSQVPHKIVSLLFTLSD